MDGLKDVNSANRVVIVSSALGMGVDVSLKVRNVTMLRALQGPKYGTRSETKYAPNILDILMETW